MTGPSTRVLISPTALSCRLDDETVILDGDRYYTLNGVASRAWELLTSQSEVTLVVQRLAEEFDVDQARLHTDITHWIEEMVARSLLLEAP
jgi:hypothetical protein